MNPWYYYFIIMIAPDKIIYTVGHSTRGIEEFISMLQSFNIEILADVRHYPGSRAFPQFNKDALEISLPAARIEYVHLMGLGGRRKPQVNSINTAWRHTAFRGYADYMQTNEFKTAVKDLEVIATTKLTAIMCSEGVWWKCHRSLIADYLKINGWKTMHILNTAKSTEHPYTSPAKIVDGKLSYREDDLFS
ncbi:MAG: hypothetical protein JWN76_119 [Chitinophagaceae bacterium]|nr:hypothetical protein [Chitinophagaceae bacterium]